MFALSSLMTRFWRWDKPQPGLHARIQHYALTRLGMTSLGEWYNWSEVLYSCDLHLYSCSHAMSFKPLPRSHEWLSRVTHADGSDNNGKRWCIWQQVYGNLLVTLKEPSGPTALRDAASDRSPNLWVFLTRLGWRPPSAHTYRMSSRLPADHAPCLSLTRRTLRHGNYCRPRAPAYFTKTPRQLSPAQTIATCSLLSPHCYPS